MPFKQKNVGEVRKLIDEYFVRNKDGMWFVKVKNDAYYPLPSWEWARLDKILGKEVSK